MIKIRALGTRELKQVLHLIEQYSEQEFEYSVLQKLQQLYVPLQRLSQLLPPAYQFVPAIYVAVSQHKVLGLIWISQDGSKNNRWKIDQLIIDPAESSYDVGTQLIHYVINRYGGEGVQTFLSFVDERYDTALGILKRCGFRRCTRLHFFTLPNAQACQLKAAPITGLREATRGDADKLKNLHVDCLVPEVRLSLEKHVRDFKRPLVKQLGEKLNGVFFKRWVVENVAHDLLIASLEMVTHNHVDYQLYLMVSPAWTEGYSDLLAFGIQQILKSTHSPQITLQTYEFNQEEIETLEKNGFSRLSVAEVLVKDYWIPIKDKLSPLSSPILLFAGKTSPACIQTRQTPPLG